MLKCDGNDGNVKCEIDGNDGNVMEICGNQYEP